MGRRKRVRRVEGPPVSEFYKPQGVPLRLLRGAVLPLDGLEALRLVDAEGLSQDDAAARMRVSRPTLTRILSEARRIVATALSQGWAIRIEGGEVTVDQDHAKSDAGGGFSGDAATQGFELGRALDEAEAQGRERSMTGDERGGPGRGGRGGGRGSGRGCGGSGYFGTPG